MARYTFKLESLLRYREHKLLLAKKDMAGIEARVNKLENIIQKAREQRGEILAMAGENMQRHAGPTFAMLSLVGNETTRMAQTHAQLHTLKEELERHRNWVIHLGKELKVVEKLEAREHLKYLSDERQKEKRQIDGWTAENWTRKMTEMAEGS